MSRPIVILGAGGHARVVADLCRSLGRAVAGFLDGTNGTEEPAGAARVIGSDVRLEDAAFVAAHDFALGVGDAGVRCRLGQRIVAAGGALPALVHPAAVVASDVEIGRGAILLAGALVGCGSRIGDYALLNTGATLDHDGDLAAGTQLGPGAHLGGDVRTGARATIGIGASVIQGIRIGEGAVVGAGAAVIRDVAAGQTVVGCPARPIGREPA
jgi:sugar O-acyltransferase (sialic acid O-acetyltransferase NeuD family)